MTRHIIFIGDYKMKKLGFILLALTLTSSVFAQTREQVAATINRTLGEKSQDFFNLTQHDYPEFIKHVGGIYYISDDVIRGVSTAINDNESIEVTSNKYLEKHPGTTYEQFDQILLDSAVNPLKNYSPSIANALLTYFEIYHRDYTDHASFVHERGYYFYASIRTALKLPALNAEVCAKAIGAQSCPPLATKKKETDIFGKQSLRLENR